MQEDLSCYLKVTTENLYQLDFAQTRKAAEDLFLEVPFIIPRFRQKTKGRTEKQEEFSESCLIPARMELGETGWS